MSGEAAERVSGDGGGGTVARRVQGVPQGVVESLLFKGVHYEMKVRVGDSVLLVHSTHARPVGTQVKLTVAPEDIQVMHKSDYSPDILKRHAARV